MFLRESLIARRLRDFEEDITEMICLELTICNKIWFIIFVYRPPTNNNKHMFSSELSNSLNRYAMEYDNMIIL